MNITPNSGADIKFYDYNDTIYTLHDDNIDNIKVDIACLGNDSNAVANTRKIEKELLLKYHLIDV